MGDRPFVPSLAGMNEDARKAILDLLDTGEPAHLGPGRRAGTVDEPAVLASVHNALPPGMKPVARQQLVLALVLLWHDHLDASHAISQGVATAEGSFVHAIMHRREPDYLNSKYWWRQTGHHPAFRELGRAAGEQLRSERQVDLDRRLLRDGVWKPSAFVDSCEDVMGRPEDDPEVMLLRELQRIEFEVLMDHLLRS